MAKITRLSLAVVAALGMSAVSQSAEVEDNYVPVFVDALVTDYTESPPVGEAAPTQIEITPAPEMTISPESEMDIEDYPVAETLPMEEPATTVTQEAVPEELPILEAEPTAPPEEVSDAVPDVPVVDAPQVEDSPELSGSEPPMAEAESTDFTPAVPDAVLDVPVETEADTPMITESVRPSVSDVMPEAPLAPPSYGDSGLKNLLDMPLELAEFEISFSPIISVSDASLRSRWACDRKAELQGAADKVASAPVFEMTKRNIDTWRRESKVLKASITEALGYCEKGESAADEMNTALEKAHQAWLTLLKSRG